MQELSKYIKEGIKRKLYCVSDDKSIITYMPFKITRSLLNPEEKVQAEALAKLVFDYNYPIENIQIYEKVTVGSDIKEADIVVYNDAQHKQPHIIVECKKESISEQELVQATNQAYAYAYAIAGTIKYVWATSGIKDVYYKVDKESTYKESVTDIPQYGVKKLHNFKYAKNGGKADGGQKLFDLEKIDESELTNKFKQAHQALWGGGELNPSEAFDELDKLIFCKIWDEKKKRKNGEPYDFQIIKVEPENSSEEAKKKADFETSRQLLERLKTLYEDGKTYGERKNDTEIFKEGIKLNSTKVRTVVGYLENVDLLHTDLDSKGRAFETFLGSFFRGDFGQFFTPRPIVSFIVDSLPITERSMVLDTSCGSGGFLLHALDKVRKQARRDCGIAEGEEESAECYRQWHDFAENNLYGIEINEQISRTAKMNMIIHDDGHTNVVSSDGLITPAELRVKTNNQGFKENHFDFIITNPPFGSIIKQTEKAYLRNYNLATKEIDWLNPSSKQSARPSQSTEVLFIEQAESYLRAGKYLAIVLPDGIITNSSMQYVRDYISETFRIVAVVSLPQSTFAANGAAVKSSVLFLRKYSEKEKSLRKNKKMSIQTKLIEESETGKKLIGLLKLKKQLVDNINKSLKKAISEEEKDQLEKEKTASIADLDNQIENLKNDLTEKFGEYYSTALNDYPVFMAIAEDIGYDATGKPTKTNELIEISKELYKFIEAIEEGKDSFFL